jgi:hypothetical protein
MVADIDFLALENQVRKGFQQRIPENFPATAGMEKGPPSRARAGSGRAL